jgi:adenine phosphoribosyltransferase
MLTSAPLLSPTALAQRLADMIRTIPDYPKPGIQFKDITTVLADGELFQQVNRALAQQAQALGAQAILGIEARGFILGAAVAHELGLPFVPVRKQGKLPAKVYRQTYALEYGEDTLELHQEALPAQTKVVILDDLLATGGTVKASLALAQQANLNVVGALFVVELDFLHGREAIQQASPINVDALVHF